MELSNLDFQIHFSDIYALFIEGGNRPYAFSCRRDSHSKAVSIRLFSLSVTYYGMGFHVQSLADEAEHYRNKYHNTAEGSAELAELKAN